MTETSDRPRTNYVLRHWRGENTLAWAFWVNGLLIVLCSLVLEVLTLTVGAQFGPYPSLLIGSMLVILSFSVVLGLWQFVGVWRSADHYNVSRGRQFWPVMAKLALLAGVISLEANLSRSGAALRDYATEAYFPSYVLSASTPDTIRLSGSLKAPAADDLIRYMQLHPQTKVVQLEESVERDSYSHELVQVKMADYEAAIKLREDIQANEWTTLTRQECAKQCFAAFIGGKQRIIDKGARLGYYQPENHSSELEQYDFLKSQGIDPSFVEEAHRISAGDLWYPTLKDLALAHVVTGIQVNGHVIPAEEYCRVSGNCR